MNILDIQFVSCWFEMKKTTYVENKNHSTQANDMQHVAFPERNLIGWKLLNLPLVESIKATSM